MSADPLVIDVIIAETQPLMLEGIQVAIEACGDIRVVGETSDPKEIVALVCDSKADLLLLGHPLGDSDTTETLRLLAHQAGLRVMVLASRCGREVTQGMLDAGACGILSRTSVDRSHLVEAIRDACRGLRVLSAEVVTTLLGSQSRYDPSGDLTPREQEVWTLMAQGLGNAEIAGRLFVSVRTIKFHVGNVLRKTGACSRAHAVAIAFDSGVVAPCGEAV